MIERHAFGLDAARPDAVARRRGDRPAHRARERRRPLRSRLVRRVRLARDRGAAPPARPRRPDPPHARRRHALRPRARERRRLRRRAQSLRRGLVRLHRPRRHPGPAEPPQEGPHLRDRARAAVAGRHLHRGRRRPPRRHRRPGRRRPRLSRVSVLRQALRPRAARRHQLGPLLRRQRRAPRLLRRGDRDRELEHRHGRPGDDRGRRPRRLPSRGGRPDDACRSPNGVVDVAVERRGRGGRGREALPRVLPGTARELGVRRPAAAADARSPRTACASTTSVR